MVVNLRDRSFTDTGLPLQGATAQAILVTGGGTDAGTSSVVQATTTTDVNGVWKFANLPDPGAGNWYDVKVTNGNQVRWHYGNIQSVIAQLQLQSTVWASPHFTSPVVDSGGLTITAGGGTITAGGLQVTAGNVGIGTAPNTNIGVWIPAAYTLGSSSATSYGVAAQPTGPAASTTEISGVIAQPSTAATGFTVNQLIDFHAANPNRGAGSTVNNAYGLYVDGIGAGTTNNYGIFVNPPSGGSGDNHAIALASGGDIAFKAGTATISGDSSNRLVLGGVATGANPGTTFSGAITVVVNGVARQIPYV